MYSTYKKATMSILGLYYINPDIFSDMVYPQELNKDTLIDNILAECAELEVCYPDPVYMQQLIRIWSEKELSNWQKLYDTTALTYNPIWNVDAHITETETRDLHSTMDSVESGTGSTVNSKTGYNDNTFVNAEQDVANNNVDRNNAGSDTGTITRTTERGGNIGVTSSQQLIREERDIAQFNVYDYITDSFKRRFCLLIY